MSEEFNVLKGRIIKRIEGLYEGSEEVRIFLDGSDIAKFYHWQDCCESVNLVDFEGDPNELEGALINDAYLETNNTDTKGIEYPDSFTWSFYRILTNKGTIFMRWLGESNGYYSESVDFEIIKE